MSKDRLVVDDRDSYKFRLTWWLADDQEMGGSVGDQVYLQANLDRPMDRADRDCAIAYLTAKATAGVTVKTLGSELWWRNRKDATNALRAINAALKADRSATPWPEWAVKATAAGWKAPKGWTP